MDELLERCKRNLRHARDPLSGLTEREIQSLTERYWRFEDSRDADGFLTRSRVLVHSLHTPRPVLHLMASGHARPRDQWGSFWDQHCGGFSCVDSVQAGKMTSHLDSNYVPTAPEPQDIRNFYVHESPLAYPMFPLSGWEEDQYKGYICKDGLDEFEIEAVRNELSGHLLVFVHPELPLEVWELTLRNASKRIRELAWFVRIRVNIDSYPFYYFVPRVVCEGLREDGSLVFLNHDKNNKHPRAAFLSWAGEPDGFDMMGEVFDGGPARSPIPAAVARGKCFNSLGIQPYAGLIAAVQYNTRLAPDQSETWKLAYGKCPPDARTRKEFVSRVRREVLGDTQRSYHALRNNWEGKISACLIHTPEDELDRYFNIWSKYQLRNQARFTRALDKVGYRDVLQDLLGICKFEPAFARRRLLETLQYQFPDGRAVRQYERFPASGHDTRMYQDSPAWIPHLLSRYVKETGDRAILDEQVPFLDPETLEIDSARAATVYDHAALAVRSLHANTGYHRLCLIGYGDWNDALSGIGGEKGVSVWLSCACVHAARMMSELADHLDRPSDRDEFAAIADEMTERINTHAWDGNWYIYAINDRGEPIGSSKSPEGKIHLNVNTWALFTGVAAAGGHEDALWESIEQLATPVGHMLLAPPYTAASRESTGRIADVAPGMFENGSIYTHGESFYLYALARAGKSDKWMGEILKTLPSRQVPDISTGPPQQQSNFFVGPDHVNFGQNPFSNFTGSVTWYRLAIERIIGVLPEFEGLRIEPRPPSEWNKYRVRRRFRGCELDIRFARSHQDRITIDGEQIGQPIPAEMLRPGRHHSVEVEYIR